MTARAWILIVAVGVGAGSFLASRHPDFLEKTLEEAGHREETPPFEIMPDYTVPGLDPGWGAAVSGVVGTLILFVVLWSMTRLVRRGRRRHHDPRNDTDPGQRERPSS